MVCPVFLCLLLLSASTISDLSYTWTRDVVVAAEPSDFQIWTAIDISLARRRELRRRKEMYHSHVRKREEKVVCYTRFIWCFRDEGPFEYWDTLPESPEIIETTFNLYTRHNLLEGDSLHYDNNSSLNVSHFNASNPVKIIIHGFGGSAANAWVGQMVEAMLETADVNVIVVDWNKGAKLPNYMQAAANSRLVGKEIAELIRLVNYERGTANEDYHLIGYSLGAHIAGFVGTEMKNLSRITGLDPAAPLFEIYDPAVRLDPSDAQFVDVIHTNGESMIRGGFGVYESMGHVDFFPNGGKFQKGCSNVFVGALSDLLWGQWHSLCHHRRAIEYFIASMEPGCSFTSVACDNYEEFVRGDCFLCSDNTSCGNMGYFTDESLPQIKMYLLTRADQPYCGIQYKVMIKHTEDQGITWGGLEITLMNDQELSETFDVTERYEEIQDGVETQSIVVAHPLLSNITKVIITYHKYVGWIYSGLDEWKINKVSVSGPFGNMFSYCSYATVLRDKQEIVLGLEPGECILPDT